MTTKSKKTFVRNSTAEFLTFALQSGDDGIEVRIQEGTIWLTQKKMGELFDTSSDNIGLHLKNIYTEGELEEWATTEDFSVVQKEGNRDVLTHAGSISAALAKQHAESEFEKYRIIQDKIFKNDFDILLENTELPQKKKK